ncbi:MAG: Smr/MutS family protein [Desulfosarcina sp.]|nr:Smr/MutS family protein [Desulfosarcina sp.]MBC2744382.1 Smr/MutS family protein [Desulfosarcina sp.]MBC2767290.1 DNA mismatch repair protein MutS [Desulfosarcina sp.]
MTHRRSSIGNRPFKYLGNLLAEKNIHLPEVCLPELPVCRLTPLEENHLFQQAMADVIPLAGRKKIAPVRPRQRSGKQMPEDPDAEAIDQLKQLVETGDGFVLRHTAEYVEGATGRIPPEMFRRIHSGYFSIQGHVDLHGLNLKAAREHFDGFMGHAIASGKRAVLVVHGRGRSSPGPPVLKRNLFRWLVSGHWKRWVIAFTSARSCDGGTGATYVLLRRRPR